PAPAVKPAAPAALSAKRLAAMAAAAVDRPDVPAPTTPARAAAASLASLGDVEVQKPRAARPAALDVAEESFDVKAPKAKTSAQAAGFDVGEFSVQKPGAKPAGGASLDVAGGEVDIRAPKPHHVPAGTGKSPAGAFEVRKDAAEGSD